MLDLKFTDVKLLIDSKITNGQSITEIMEWTSNLTLETTVAAEVDNYLISLDGHKPSTESENKYIEIDEKGNASLKFATLVNDLLAEYHWLTMTDNEDCYLYADGYYQDNAIQFIKAECQRRVGVGRLLTKHVLDEIVGHIKRTTYITRNLLNANTTTINLKNGLLNIRTRELTPHTPLFLGTIRIPVEYRPDADRSVVTNFFRDVHQENDIPLIREIIGYCLIPDYKIQQAMLFVGGGENGKSTELNLIKEFIGKANISNVPWQALEVNRFAKSALEGKLVNIFADLPSRGINDTTAFKMLTGGDEIGTEKKYGAWFSFCNFARMIFSTNKPPIVKDEDSYAFWRRWDSP